MKWLGVVGSALLLMLATGAASAQVAVTKCIKSMDSPISYCNSYVNDDLSLAPGSYQVRVRVFDATGNPSEAVIVDGAAVVKGADTTPPIIKRTKLTRVGENVYRVDVECEDNEHCADAEVTVTPAP